MLHKPAETQYPIHDMLKRRWSPVAFSDRLIEPWKLQSLFEAARWAPSSMNEQPWSFVIVTRDNPQEFQAVLNCLSEVNVPWAKEVPVLLAAAAKLQFDRDRRPNPHAWYDMGQSVAHLTFQAVALGLSVHQMAGFHTDKLRTALNVPAEYAPVTVIALGYPGSAEKLPEKLQQRNAAIRTRHATSQFVFHGKWNHPYPLLNGPE